MKPPWGRARGCAPAAPRGNGGQPDRTKLWPEWSNRHADAFLAYARANGRFVAELSGAELEVYALTAAPR